MEQEKYIAAIGTHKFYDSMSITIVGGFITVSGALLYLLEKIQTTTQQIGSIILTVFVITTLLGMYRKCAYYANVARNVSAKLESGECATGVSTVLKNLHLEEFAEYRAIKRPWRGIYGLVHFLWLSLVTGLLLLAMSLG